MRLARPKGERGSPSAQLIHTVRKIRLAGRKRASICARSRSTSSSLFPVDPCHERRRKVLRVELALAAVAVVGAVPLALVLDRWIDRRLITGEARRALRQGS